MLIDLKNYTVTVRDPSSRALHIPHHKYPDSVVFSDSNCIDYLGTMYGNGASPAAPPEWNELHHNRCWVCRIDPRAVIPFKVKASDVGYDLMLIRKVKNFNAVTVLYDTGIQLKPENGYYAEIVPRSSLSKSGYILSNSVGIIDPSYRGNIYISLTKVDPAAPELGLPFQACQLIFRRQHFVTMKTVKKLDTTERGEGGFGSTTAVLPFAHTEDRTEIPDRIDTLTKQVVQLKKELDELYDKLEMFDTMGGMNLTVHIDAEDLEDE